MTTSGRVLDRRLPDTERGRGPFAAQSGLTPATLIASPVSVRDDVDAVRAGVGRTPNAEYARLREAAQGGATAAGAAHRAGVVGYVGPVIHARSWPDRLDR